MSHKPSGRSVTAPRFRRHLTRVACFCLLFLPRHATAFQDPGKRLKIGVALQGGGAKGLAHIGVLQWFEDNHIPIDYIAGTSMGGLIGGLYATGNSPAEIERMVKAINWGEVMSGSIPYQDLAFRRKEDLRAFPNGLELGLRNGVESPGGLNSGQRVRLIIDRSVLAYSNVHNFDNLPIPFRCVGTDLVSGKRVVFHDGSLPEALRATMSIPAVFAPIKGENGGVYADGGLLDNLPTDVVKQMGADIVIGVHLTTGPVSPSNVRSMFQVAGASTDVMISANEVRGMEQADILITVNLAGYTTLDFSRVQEIIAKGTEAAVPRSAVLAPYRLSDSDWKAHLAERDSRRVKTVPVPQFVEVRGTDPHVASDLEENLSPFVDKPIETPELERHIIRAAGLGRFNTVSYGLTTRNEKPGLLINAEEKEYSPPWLKPGFVIDGSDPNNVQFALGARITFLDLGGYRSELRTDFSFGSTYLIGTEYYHPFTPTTRWFIAPAVQASRSPLNLYVRGTFLAEYKLNDVLGSFDLGYAIDRFSELRFGYQAGYSKSSRWSGSPLLPSVSGRTGLSRVRYVVDRLDNPIIPRTGFSVALNGGWVDANPGAKTGFPSGELSFQAFHRLSDPGSLYLVGAGGSTFGYNRVGIPQFSLGSPARLAAYGINEYLTNQYVYGRLGYLHRVGELPAILGSGWYLDGHVEAAKPYGPARVSNVPGDFAGGIIMQTILGPVLVGASIGESGHHKWFFQLGRVF